MIREARDSLRVVASLFWIGKTVIILMAKGGNIMNMTEQKYRSEGGLLCQKTE